MMVIYQKMVRRDGNDDIRSGYWLTRTKIMYMSNKQVGKKGNTKNAGREAMQMKNSIAMEGKS